MAVGSDKILKNGLRYQVLKLPAGEEAKDFRVQNIDERGVKVGEAILVEPKKLALTLRLSHAICYFSCQARTITGGLRLSQTNHKFVTRRHLVVGLGRGPEGHCIEVE